MCVATQHSSKRGEFEDPAWWSKRIGRLLDNQRRVRVANGQGEHSCAVIQNLHATLWWSEASKVDGERQNTEAASCSH